jgi:hypothetical protein
VLEAWTGRAGRAKKFSLSSSESDEERLRRAAPRRRNLAGSECSLRGRLLKRRRLVGDGDGEISGDEGGLVLVREVVSSISTWMP